jgi:hypothetical protein
VDLIDAAPKLRDLVLSRTVNSLTLKRKIEMETLPASWRTARGGTAISICLDEAAMLRGEDSA